MITVQEIGGGAILRTFGDFHISEMVETKRDLSRKFSGGVPWLFIIVDLSEATSLTGEDTELEKLVVQDRVLATLTRPGLPFAVVAPQDAYFGVARMWQATSEETGWDTKILRDRVSAETWIRDRVLAKFGVPVPPLHSPTPNPQSPNRTS
jgi:hypothetical protein